jgi:hypothetical protein
MQSIRFSGCCAFSANRKKPNKDRPFFNIWPINPSIAADYRGKVKERSRGYLNKN